jgi:hypothetical protein
MRTPCTKNKTSASPELSLQNLFIVSPCFPATYYLPPSQAPLLAQLLHNPYGKKHPTADKSKTLLTSVDGLMRVFKNNSTNRKSRPDTVIADIQHEYTDLISTNWRKLLGERAPKNILKIRRKNHERTYRKISRRSIRFLRRKLSTLEAQQNQNPRPS